MRTHIKTLREIFWTVVFLAAAAGVMLAAFRAARGEDWRPLQCPGGSCRSTPFDAETISERRPTPAWRYEKPVAHRAAVVRVFCRDDLRTRSIGSGALVRWNGRVVVLTARHVIADAKNILIELHTRRTHAARVLKTDATWDCAVLDIDAARQGLPAAEVQLGDEAMLRGGQRLESCGYGPDGRLAVNSGVFLSYKRSSATPNGPDDWLELSGRARQGDSGGPIFNRQGKLVGVLWGTNGEVVVGVQAGRIHRLLDAAAPPVERKAFVPVAYEAERHPTAPKGDDCQDGSCERPILPGPLPCTPSVEEAKQEKLSPILPWRNETQRRDDAQDARIRALIELQERQAREPAAPKTEAAPATGAKVEPAKQEAVSPLAAGACILVAVALAAALYYLTAKGS